MMNILSKIKHCSLLIVCAITFALNLLPARTCFAMDAQYWGNEQQQTYEEQQKAYEEQKKYTKCTPYKYYAEMENGCTFCSIFVVTYNTASKIALRAIEVFSGPIKTLIVLMFALWIAIKILQFSSSFEVKDLKDLVSGLVIQGFIVLLVFTLLNGNVMSFLNLTLRPVYTTGQKLAQKIISADQVICPADTGIIDDSKGQGALPKSMGDSIICTMRAVQNRVSKVKALGEAAICKSWEDKWLFIPQLNYFFTGLGLWIGAVIMLLAVPLMLVDSVFQMTIAAALLPFAIGSYAFKITRGYTKKIWETFLNSVFCFIFITLICLMLVSAYESIISGAIGNNFDEMFVAEKLEATIMVKILNNIAWYTTSFLSVVFVMILAWSVLGGGKELGQEFAGSISNTSIGSSIGTMGASFSKSFALKAGEKTGEAVWRNGSRIFDGAGTVGKKLVNRAITKSQGSRAVKHGNRQADGSYEYSNMFGKFKVVQNADGSYKVEKNRKRLFGLLGTKQIIRDGDNVTERVLKTKKDGSVVIKNEKVKNHSFDAEMFNKDGTLNGFGKESNFEEELKKIELSSTNDAEKEEREITLISSTMRQLAPHLKNEKYLSRKVIKNKDGSLGYVQNNADGSRTIVNMQIKEVNGKKVMLFTYTNVDKNGKGTILKSNGIFHSKTHFKTKDGTISGEIDEKTIKKEYGLNKYHEEYRRHHRGRHVNKLLDTYTVGFEDELNDLASGIDNYMGIREFGTYNG